jgi:hypothetical protein
MEHSSNRNPYLIRAVQVIKETSGLEKTKSEFRLDGFVG